MYHFSPLQNRHFFIQNLNQRIKILKKCLFWRKKETWPFKQVLKLKKKKSLKFYQHGSFRRNENKIIWHWFKMRIKLSINNYFSNSCNYKKFWFNIVFSISWRNQQEKFFLFYSYLILYRSLFSRISIIFYSLTLVTIYN